MGPDRSSGTIIEWDVSSKTGVIEDDTRDHLVYFALHNYALARYSTDEYQFMPNVGEAVDYVLMYYDNPTAIGITNDKYWAYWHHINEANVASDRNRKRFIISLTINIILIMFVFKLGFSYFASI